MENNDLTDDPIGQALFERKKVGGIDKQISEADAKKSKIDIPKSLNLKPESKVLLTSFVVADKQDKTPKHSRRSVYCTKNSAEELQNINKRKKHKENND